MPPELRERFPVLILLVLITCTSIYDWTYGLESWMAVPLDITRAWESALTGDFSGSVIGDLASALGAAFLHADAGHLIGNFLFLWIFGAVVSDLVGWKWFATIFIITAIGGSLGQLALNPYDSIPGLGASGAVMGLGGAYLGLSVQKERPMAHVWPLARPVSPVEIGAVGIAKIAMDFMGVFGPDVSNIAYGAHIGGFVTGVLLVLFRRS